MNSELKREGREGQTNQPNFFGSDSAFSAPTALNLLFP